MKPVQVREFGVRGAWLMQTKGGQRENGRQIGGEEKHTHTFFHVYTIINLFKYTLHFKIKLKRISQFKILAGLH